VLLALRNTVEASPIADRALLLLQTLSLGVPVAIDLQRGRLQQAFVRFSPGAVRLVALIVIAVSAATALHVFIGFSGPARSLRAGAGSVMGYGLVFGATALALYGLALALLARPPLCWLRSARAADPGLLRALRAALGVAAIGGVAVVTLGNLRLTAATLSAVDSLLDSTVVVGAVSLPATAIAAAAGIALGTLVLSAVTEFVLDREVFPRLRLRPGVGDAIATFTRWVILIAGTLLALAALGIDTTKLTLVAGALSVGIGFGLQHVVNNFVSGLILIIERPVSVGDLVEIGPLIGEIKRIGMRSSSVRTTQGAEVIVPNSDLASKEVINWTRSDRQRRYNIDVGVAYGSDPVRVMRLLEEAAREVPEVMSEPAPMAMFQGFGDSSLDFRLLAWVSTIDLGPQAQTALRIAVLRKLEAAGIEIPFPQRDVHLVTPPAPATPPKAPATEPR
jgi:small-conductance mechanosensitive channel